MKRKSEKFTLLLILLFCIAFPRSFSQDGNWTHFRGSSLNGIAEKGDYPAVWNDQAIKWKTEIHGKGYSSPVVFGNQVWISTSTPDGKELYAVCTDFETGNIIYDIRLFSPAEVEGKHSINTYASPSPCIEKDFVYVHFGSMGTACIRTTDGTVVWTRNDLKCKHVQGPGSSPVIYKNLLILHLEGTDVRYLTALDKTTGKTVWKTERPQKPYEALAEIGRKAYVTPIIVNVNGRDLLISNGSAVCCAYDPLTGEEVWQVVRGAESTVPMPVEENGIIYYYCGYMVDAEASNFTELIAVNPSGSGDITSTNVLWRKRDNQNQTQMLTPVIKDGLIYTINTKNNMMCIDASDGKEVWSVRQRAGFNSSPVYANGIIWFCSVKGDVIGIKEGRTFEPVFQGLLDSGIWATPAFVRNSVIVRSERFLYRIGK